MRQIEALVAVRACGIEPKHVLTFDRVVSIRSRLPGLNLLRAIKQLGEQAYEGNEFERAFRVIFDELVSAGVP